MPILAVPGSVVSTGLVVMWSSGFIGAELGTREAGTETLLMWRFLAATVLLGGAWLLLRRRRIHHRALGGQVVVGLLSQGVYLGSIVGAIELGVPLGTAALIAALQPLLAGTLAGRLLGERTTARQWIGVVGGLAGVALVVSGDLGAGSQTPWPAFGLPFLGMAGLLGASFVERRLRHPLSVADALPVHCAVSAVAFAAAATVTGRVTPPASGQFWLAVGWVVALSTVGAYGFYWLSVRRNGVTHTSALMYLTPPTTMVWAYLMFGDAISTTAVIGLFVCLAGVVTATTAGRGGDNHGNGHVSREPRGQNGEPNPGQRVPVDAYSEGRPVPAGHRSPTRE